MYVDMVGYEFRTYVDLGWSNEELNELSEKIQEVKY